MILPTSSDLDLVLPHDPRFASVRSTFFRGGHPAVVLRPTNASEVAQALGYARANQPALLSLRSGGHGVRGRSTNEGGMVLDLSRMNKIDVVDPARRVRVEPGARWMQVASALAPLGWAITSGDDGRVGVGGLATAGGVGLLGRAHGLTIDRLRSIEVVLADGTIVQANEKQHSDLFWAMRGAGSAFGVATAFEFEAQDVKNVGWSQAVLDASDTAAFLEAWGSAVENAPRDLTSFLILSPSRRGQPTVAFVSTLVNSDSESLVRDRIHPILNLAPVFDSRVEILPYAQLIANGQVGPQYGQGEPVSRSGSIPHLTAGFGKAIAELFRQGEVSFFQIRSMGGAISDVPIEATAFGSRKANFEVTVAGLDRRRLDLQWDVLSPHFSGLSITFDTDSRPERLRDAFPPQTLERLVRLKRQYDPGNVFRDQLDFRPWLADDLGSGRNPTPSPPTSSGR